MKKGASAVQAAVVALAFLIIFAILAFLYYQVLNA